MEKYFFVTNVNVNNHDVIPVQINVSLMWNRSKRI